MHAVAGCRIPARLALRGAVLTVCAVFALPWLAVIIPEALQARLWHLGRMGMGQNKATRFWVPSFDPLPNGNISHPCPLPRRYMEVDQYSWPRNDHGKPHEVGKSFCLVVFPNGHTMSRTQGPFDQLQYVLSSRILVG